MSTENRTPWLLLLLFLLCVPCSGQSPGPLPQPPDTGFGDVPASAYLKEWTSVALIDPTRNDTTTKAILASGGSFVVRLSTEPPVDAVLGRYQGKGGQEGNLVALVAHQRGVRSVLYVHTRKGRALPSFYWNDGWYLSFVPETGVVARIGV